MTRLVKFGYESETGSEVPFDYDDVYAYVRYNDGTTCLKAGVSRNQCNVIADLATALTPPFWLLYVLIVPRDGRGEGRYQADESLDRSGLTAFLDRYGVLFEQDGRHALWVGAENGQLVFTPHDIVYAYGPLEEFEQILHRRDFVPREFDIPSPHTHYYNESLDGLVVEMLNERDWTHYPLQDIDDET
jgi:hypothetical protein